MIDLLPVGWMAVVVVLWGAVWGSFANVAIARIPHGQSVAFPASHCPNCETPIRWFDNLPIVSWFVLRGACRSCKEPISIRYPLIEFGGILCSLASAWAVSGGVTLWRLEQTSPLEVTAAWMLLSFFFLLLMMLTVIDLEHLLLPHRLTITLAVLAVVYAYVVPPGGDWRGFVPSLTVREALIGFVVAYGSLFLFAMVYAIVRGRQGMGGGDFMLFGALGAWFGIEALPMLMLLAALQGVLIYLVALFFFPSLIHEVDPEDEAFWDARVADGTAQSQRSAASGTPEASLALASSGGERDSEAGREDLTENPTQRGVPFGPFLCLAAVEFVAFGGAYFQWLNGGV